MLASNSFETLASEAPLSKYFRRAADCFAQRFSCSGKKFFHRKEAYFTRRIFPYIFGLSKLPEVSTAIVLSDIIALRISADSFDLAKATVIPQPSSSDLWASEQPTIGIKYPSWAASACRAAERSLES